MKKIKYLFILILGMFFLTGCEVHTVTRISYEKLKEKLENQDSFILMIGATEYPHCNKFKITLSEIIEKYKVKIYYVDVDDLSKTEYSDLKKLFPFSGTPTTVNIVEGKEANTQSRIDGALDYGVVKKRLIKWGYIKEE